MKTSQHAAEIFVRCVRISGRFLVDPKCDCNVMLQVRSCIGGGWRNRLSTVGEVATDSDLSAEGLMSVDATVACLQTEFVVDDPLVLVLLLPARPHKADTFVESSRPFVVRLRP